MKKGGRENVVQGRKEKGRAIAEGRQGADKGKSLIAQIRGKGKKTTRPFFLETFERRGQSARKREKAVVTS